MTTLLAIAFAVTPLLALAGLLRLAEWIQRRRDEGYARQVALTDAIHRQLGAVAAPMMRRRRGGGWLVSMTVPFDRPATIAAILRITDELFASQGGSALEDYEVVLMRQPMCLASKASSGPCSAAEQAARAAA